MRVSATELDAFRYYRDHEEAELDALLAQLRRESPPSQAMAAGSAFHKALELAQPGEFDVLQHDGFTFHFAIPAEISLPTIRELKSTREYVVSGVPVTLVGMVDALHGRCVEDHKTTARFDAERFLNSYQWRIYLDIFDADLFRWNIFEWSQNSDDPHRYDVRALHTLQAYRYPTLSQDIQRELEQFVDFAKVFLPERLITQEAA